MTLSQIQSKTSSCLSGASKTTIAVVFVIVLAWAYQAIQPPAPKICGSPNGPPVTAPRIKLKDGRHLAYKEHGVPQEKANYKIVYIHGYDSCRHDALPISQEVAEEVGIYMVSFDRSGYGESDPNPRRREKSIALDVEELADQLGLGSKFYVIGFSMGGEAVWGCLKYIPHRLKGATLLAPVANYWWPGFPANLSSNTFYRRLKQDQWTVGIAHYLPWLTYWWNTQKWFPACSVAADLPEIYPEADKTLFPKFLAREPYLAQVRQQGESMSIHQDLIVGFGNWEFDPMDLKDLFPNKQGSVHLWMGDKDGLVHVELQRYIAQALPWIHYHELPQAGHMFPWADGMADAIVKALLVGDN